MTSFCGTNICNKRELVFKLGKQVNLVCSFQIVGLLKIPQAFSLDVAEFFSLSKGRQFYSDRRHILLDKVAADFLVTEMFLHRYNILKVKSLTFAICPRFLHADVLPRDPLQAMSQLLGKRTLTQVENFYTCSKLL